MQVNTSVLMTKTCALYNYFFIYNYKCCIPLPPPSLYLYETFGIETQGKGVCSGNHHHDFVCCEVDIETQRSDFCSVLKCLIISEYTDWIVNKVSRNGGEGVWVS